MAGFLKRVRRVTLGKISAFLDGVENPEEVFPQLMVEMREECRKAIDAEATAIAAMKRRRMEYDSTLEDVEKWANRARLAVGEGNDDLARTALEKQIATEKKLQGQKRALEGAKVAADRAREAREELHKKVEVLESKKDEILARARAAKQQERVQKVLAGMEDSGASILDAVARMEDKVVEAEARTGAYSDIAMDMAGGDTESKFRELERKQFVEDRLAELKRKLVEDKAKADAPHA